MLSTRLPRFSPSAVEIVPCRLFTAIAHAHRPSRTRPCVPSERCCLGRRSSPSLRLDIIIVSASVPCSSRRCRIRVVDGGPDGQAVCHGPDRGEDSCEHCPAGVGYAVSSFVRVPVRPQHVQVVFRPFVCSTSYLRSRSEHLSFRTTALQRQSATWPQSERALVVLHRALRALAGVYGCAVETLGRGPCCLL